MKSEKLKSLLKLALKILFVALVFYWLSKKGLISLSTFSEGREHPQHLILGFAAIVLITLLAAIRWQGLLRAQNLQLHWLRTLQLHFVGTFFNVTLPGAVSGDFVKAYYVAGEIQGQRARAFGTILFDRIVGVSALVLVSAGALLFNLHQFLGTSVLTGVKVCILSASAGVVLFYGYLFLVRESFDPFLNLLKKFEGRFTKVSSVKEIYLGIRHYHSHRRAVLTALLLSVLIQMGAGYACSEFAYALGQTQLTLSSLYVVVPLGLLVTAIPVLPGGVGTGHAAFSVFFGLIGSERGADVFSFFVVGQILLGAVGGLIYLRFKSKSAPLSHAQERDLTSA